MISQREQDFYNDFKKITDKWCSIFIVHDGTFGDKIKLDDSFTSKELKEIANLLDKYTNK